jgi:5'-methylthioadenosine phosphorylase
MNCIIGGTSLLNSSTFAEWDEKKIETPYGSIFLKTNRNNVFLQRHGDNITSSSHPYSNPAFLDNVFFQRRGSSTPLPPHRINHRANIWALKSLNVQKTVSINSVGSLKIALKPGMFVIPEDFTSIWQIPTFFDDEMRFMVPEMNSTLRGYIYTLCKQLKIGVKSGGIYIQTMGPRLETKAEIRMLKKFGDVVGMTMASEATLCLEYNIPYVSLCSIDNYCNGILEVPLTLKEMKENVLKNMGVIETIVQTILIKDFS